VDSPRQTQTQSNLADGHRSERSWLRATVRLSDTDISRRVGCIRLFRRHPDVAELVERGRLGVAQARALALALRHPRAGQYLELYLPWLVDVAMNEDFDVFSRQLHEWQQLVDTDGGHRDHTAAHEGRHCNLATLADTTYLHAQFGNAQAATIKEVLDHFTDAEYATDLADAKARLGTDTTAPSALARTPAQRRADALHAIFLAAADAPTGGKTPDVCVDIIIDHHTFLDALADLADPLHHHRHHLSAAGAAVGLTTCPDTDDPGDLTAVRAGRLRCHSRQGDPIDPYDAVVAALCGHVRRVVVGSDGVIINQGRRCRLFRGSGRDAALLQAALDRGGRCIWPGCGLTHCQIDHTTEWADHGPTDIANSGPGCGHHNRFKSRGYQARRDHRGHWHLYRPDGTEIVTT